MIQKKSAQMGHIISPHQGTHGNGLLGGLRHAREADHSPSSPWDMNNSMEIIK